MGTTSAPVELVKNLILQIPAMFADATVKAYIMLWNALMQILAAHWVSVLPFVIFLLVVSAFVAFATGRWGWFGSVLYHIFFLGALLITGLIFGPAIFANDYFEIVTAVLYLLCFWLVGRILKATGLRRY